MITILKAQAEDAREIMDIKLDAFKEEIKLYGFAPPGYDDMTSLNSAIEKGQCYKIVDVDKIIGGMGIVDRGEGHYWLAVIFIDLSVQNRGIGTLAMNFMEKEFPDARKWTLETPYLSYRNHHFYEKMGFTKVGEIEPEPEHKGFLLFLYEKLIS